MRARELREHPGMRGATLGPGAFAGGKDVWTPEAARPKPVPVIPATWLRLDDARDGGGRHVVGLFLLPENQPIALMLSAAQAAELRDGLTTVLNAMAADDDPGDAPGSAVPTPGPAPVPPALVLALTADPAAGIGG